LAATIRSSAAPICPKKIEVESIGTRE
jgi:hypothetical protein